MSADSLFKDVEQFIRQYVFLSDAQACVLALWVGHSHVFEAADATPYLAITSSEKGSGKTQTLQTLKYVVNNPWFTGRVSAAVLVRKTDKELPTLLLDESDAAFASDKEYAEALRGILNSGYRRGGKTSLCVGQGANIGYKDFSTFSPKGIAGIGRLPDTVADRSIPIRLKRKLPSETVARFHERDVELGGAPIRKCLEKWSDAALPYLQNARPNLPESLSDRQQDVVEPLLAIADLTEGEWPERARTAVTSIFGAALAQDESVGVRLLADIRDIFTEREDDCIPSAELVEALTRVETSPWAEWSHGKPITKGKLARLLRGFEIGPQTICVGMARPRGYLRDDFKDVWGRYPLSYPHSQSATPLKPAPGAASSDFQSATEEKPVALQNSEKTAPALTSSGVALSKPPQRGNGSGRGVFDPLEPPAGRVEVEGELSTPSQEGKGNGKGPVEKPDTPAKRKQREFFEGEVGL